MGRTKSPQNQSMEIMEKLLSEQLKSSPIFLGDIHQRIHKFSKKNGFDANAVASVLKKITLETFAETFSVDFSKKPKFRGHGHGGH